MNNINVHSDDEYSAELQGNVVHTPVSQSGKLEKFIRRAESEMEASELALGKRRRQRLRIRPEQRINSEFLKAPMMLPLDCYDKAWFNSQPAHVRRLTVDHENVMFLPNTQQSLLAKPHPDEKLGDKKFTEKYWDIASRGYDLDYLQCNPEAEDGSDDDSEDDTYCPGSIDLDNTDGEDNDDDEPNEYDKADDVDEEEEEDEGNEDEEEEEEIEEEVEEVEVTRKVKRTANKRSKDNAALVETQVAKEVVKFQQKEDVPPPGLEVSLEPVQQPPPQREAAGRNWYDNDESESAWGEQEGPSHAGQHDSENAAGRGAFYVEDVGMVDEEEEARAARFDAWYDA